MVELTDEQKRAVGEWAEAGATLNDIQSRLKAEFGLSMTYMEARLLAMELEVRLKDKTAKAATAVEAVAENQTMPGGGMAEEEFEGPDPANFPLDEAEEEEAGVATFEMAKDELVVPGALVSGTATFSDGMKAKWFLDQTGRLSLKAERTGYQPPQVDVPKFQKGLEKILVKMGMY
jgi:hypothetical protein